MWIIFLNLNTNMPSITIKLYIISVFLYYYYLTFYVNVYPLCIITTVTVKQWFIAPLP